MKLTPNVDPSASLPQVLLLLVSLLLLQSSAAAAAPTAGASAFVFPPSNGAFGQLRRRRRCRPEGVIGEEDGAAAGRTPTWRLSSTTVTASALLNLINGDDSNKHNNDAKSDGADEAAEAQHVRDSWSLLVLGDLHMEDDMSSHERARRDCVQALKELSLLLPTRKGSGNSSCSDEDDDVEADGEITVKDVIREIEDARAKDLSPSQLEMLLSYRRDGDLMKCHLVSLGDLGRKDIRHEPGDAGTTKSFQDAKTYLGGFDGVPYELVTGNHDLEGLDEFATDRDNLQAWMDCFDKPTPYFCKQIGEKTLLLGLSTVRFRDAPFSSHEVHVDDEQLQWFVDVVESHPAKDGWKILVFSHAPIMGSGLRVLQNVHVVNGCAWLNHCSDNRKAFIRTVKRNPQIKMWFSGASSACHPPVFVFLVNTSILILFSRHSHMLTFFSPRQDTSTYRTTTRTRYQEWATARSCRLASLVR